MTLPRWIFVATMLFTVVAALLPGAEAPDLGAGDKVNHMLAFVMLSVLAAWAWPRARLWAIAVAMSALGAAIEGLQALPIIARDAEWADWVADTAAAAVALFAVAAIRAWRASAKR